MTELILGTAQFGTSYGITNATGRLDDDEISSILSAAADAGIRLFDTAPDYGDAQDRLGRLNAAHPGARYVSKFSLPATGKASALRLYEGTLAALGVPTLHGLLFHKPADLRDARAADAWSLMRDARDAGAVTRIGVSIYDADDLAVAVEAFPGMDLIQLPGSVVDRRLLDAAEVRALHDAGVEIHVRSAYLQGLLLIEPDDIPEHLAPLRPVVAELREVASERGTTVMGLALGHLAQHPVVDAVLVGATTARELSETVEAWADALTPRPAFAAPALAPAVVDPRAWPSQDAS